MIIYVLSTFIFVVVVAGMAIGYILRKREIKGSCGGIASISDITGPCEICGDDKNKCETR